MPRRLNAPLESTPSIDTSPPVRVSLLGGLRIERPDGPPITRFQTQKTAALLAYLALYSTRAHGRELLIDLFWPDAALEDGRRSLRTALASLRKQLEPPGTPMGTALIADRAMVRLNPAGCETDVARFEAACLAETDSPDEDAEERLAAAMALYVGPLLPGFYDEWAIGERQRFADLYRDLLLRRAALAEQRGGLSAALDYVRRAVNLEQDREAAGTEAVCQSAHIAVIRLLARTGRHDEARRHYDLLAERLEDIYDEDPSPEARAALDHAPDRVESPPPVSVPPAVSAGAPSHRRQAHLPLPLTRFFGRGPERDSLTNAFAGDACRLVTLIGPGGAGKTRLALEWARQYGKAFPSAIVCFVPLADLARAEYLWTAIAGALGLERLPDPGAVRAQVCDALRGSGVTPGDNGPLLILDNFEAWVDAGAPLVESLLQAVPQLRIVVTSRRRLQIGGEREVPVGPLPVPTLPGTPERLLEWASVQLFVDRAQSARPDYQITQRSAPTIAALCQRLDGIPLALELTAAWAGSLSSAQMLERIEARLLDEAGPPLAHRRAQRPERHRTLRAALDTSFSLLSADLRRAFARLSVFHDGWTLAAAEPVLSELSSPASDLLSRLRERSLVVAETGADGDSLRFRLLTALREFADDALGNPEREAARRAHAAYYLRFAEDAAAKTSGSDARENLDALETEHDNIRAALRFWLTKAGTEEDGFEESLRLAGAMAGFWNLRGYWQEGSDWLSRALALSGDSPDRAPLRAHALLGRGRIAYQQADYPVARSDYEEARDIWQELGEESRIGPLLLGLAGIAFHEDNDYERARCLTEECLALRRKLGDKTGIAATLAGLASIAAEQGDYQAAGSYWSECLERERELGDRENEANALFGLGNVALHLDRLDEARMRYEESLSIQRDLGNRQRIGYSWSGLGHVATNRGDYAEARRCYEAALQIARQLNESWAIAILLNNLGKLAYEENDMAKALSLCSESLRLRAAAGDRAGASRVLEVLASIAAARPESHPRAVTLWGAAYGLRQQLGIALAGELQSEHDEALTTIRASIGDAVFDSAWARGLALPFTEIIRFALSI